MDVRFITRTMHAYLDYPVAVILVAAPFLLHLGQSHPLAMWVSVATGVAAFALTLLTDHQLGLFRVLPFGFHRFIDGLVGVSFLAAPLAFGFQGLDAWYYWANGIAVLLVVSLHKSVSSDEKRPSRIFVATDSGSR